MVFADSEDGSEEHSNSKDGSQGHSDSEDGFKDHLDSEKRSGSKDMEVDEAVEKGGTDIGSYGGYLVRARVKITTITNWKDVSPTLKKNLWIFLKEKFKLDTNERSIRTSVMGRLWKAFKSRLTRWYILPFKNKPKRLKKIPKLYRKVISQEDCDTFVKSRLTPEFLFLESPKEASIHVLVDSKQIGCAWGGFCGSLYSHYTRKYTKKARSISGCFGRLRLLSLMAVVFDLFRTFSLGPDAKTLPDRKDGGFQLYLNDTLYIIILDMIKGLYPLPTGSGIFRLPRLDNRHADAFAYVASMLGTNEARTAEMDGPPRQYLIGRYSSIDEKQAWKLKYKAARYFALVGYNLSEMQSMRRKQKKFNHRIGRMSIANRVEKKRQEEGTSFIGKDRSYGWQLSVQGKDGKYANDATKEVAERIDDYQMQVKEGTLEVEGTKDVLTLALGTPEHGGRVRGVGDRVTPTQYFRLIKRGSKKHVRALESKACEEEEKRKKGEQKRKKAKEKGKEERKKRKELKNKYKELEENFNDRLTSPASEKIASNSHKSDNRDHIPPLGGAHSKRKPKNKEEKSRLLETNSEPDFRKVLAKGTSHSPLPNPMLPLGKTKKANSPIPAKNSKKENAEVASHAPVRNHTLDLGKGRSCSLAVDFKSNVIAKGIVYEKLGPETKLHNVPLGQYNLHVAVGKILEDKEQALLPVPVGDKLKFVEDAIGSHVAWPRELVVKANQVKISMIVNL
ncbi:hypothetical protein IFM89_027719 [Coptis chinensis]|uniref:DUF8039 domain-containing protein n=1 Tax=Coptis chinensis TaxID=261450 RepID=A0A835HV77_9MAGN|nr:hypothetical protein IFM89_027719 [Coptis chinensis]